MSSAAWTAIVIVVAVVIVVSVIVGSIISKRKKKKAGIMCDCGCSGRSGCSHCEEYLKQLNKETIQK